MTDSVPSKFAALVELSKVDAAVARLGAEEKKLDTELKTRRAELTQRETQFKERSRIFQERQALVTREQSAMRDERDRLVVRRKALGTLNNYKLAQSAEKEIQNASRELDVRETALKSMVKDFEKLREDVGMLELTVEDQRTTLAKREDELLAELNSLAERKREGMVRREELVKGVDSTMRSLYDRSRIKFPTDPIVPLKGTSCSGCFMQIGPQLVVQMLQGQQVVRCPGCSRILMTEEAGK